jgi:hypothetical protein
LAHPLLWASLAFSAEILFSRYSTTSERWTPPNWELIASVIVLCAATFWVRTRPLIATVMALLALSLLGAAQYQLQSPITAAPLLWALENQEVTIRGYVSRASIPVVESGNSDNPGTLSAETYQQLDMQVQQVEVDEQTQKLATGVRVSVYGPQK